MVVDRLPVPVDKRRYKQEKCTLRLMEIRHKDINDPECEARDNDDAGACLQLVKTVFIKSVRQSAESFRRSIAVFPFIRSPLLHIFRMPLLHAAYTYII